MCVTRSVNIMLVVFAIALLVGMFVDKRSETAAPVALPASSVTVVDVARGVEPSSIASLVRLGANERVIAVDDQSVANDLAAGAAIERMALAPGRFLDLTVGSTAGNRRVLVLMH